MLSAGQLIWASCRPLIRLVIGVAFGFGLAKADIFPQEAARGAGQIILNVTMPCLMFSKIVPSFSSDNVSALGPLFLVAFLYGVLGIASAALVRHFYWVPHRFRHGILVAGGWGNYGDIPTAVVMSICGSVPFNGEEDQTRAVAYVSAFILVFLITLFPMGGSRLIARDFVGPDVEDEDIKLAARRRRHALFTGTAFTRDLPAALGWLRRRAPAVHDEEVGPEDKIDGTVAAQVHEKVDESTQPTLEHAHPIMVHRAHAGRHVSFSRSPESRSPIIVHSPAPTAVHSPSPTEHFHSRAPTETHVELEAPNRRSLAPPNTSSHPLLRRIARSFLSFLRGLCTPASLIVPISLFIALIPPLKALFLAPDAPRTLHSYHISSAPDGGPPLGVLLDTADFIGAASVPLGLVCLGGALARLKAPRGREGWARMPLGAIGALAVLKTLVMPVLGVLICEGLTRVGVIDRDDKVLRFVCIFFSCLPTATTQVFLTQVYSGTGDAEHLSSFLIPQYILMFVSMTGLTAYSLQLIF